MREAIQRRGRYINLASTAISHVKPFAETSSQLPLINSNVPRNFPCFTHMRQELTYVILVMWRNSTSHRITHTILSCTNATHEHTPPLEHLVFLPQTSHNPSLQLPADPKRRCPGECAGHQHVDMEWMHEHHPYLRRHLICLERL